MGTRRPPFSLGGEGFLGEEGCVNSGQQWDARTDIGSVESGLAGSLGGDGWRDALLLPLRLLLLMVLVMLLLVMLLMVLMVLLVLLDRRLLRVLLLGEALLLLLHLQVDLNLITAAPSMWQL